MNATVDEPIAIIGIGCRFPGDAETPSKFWRMLCEGRDGIREVPQERWDIRRFYDPDPDKPGKTYTKFGGYLRQSIEHMDALFFGISPREAENLDPQQRLLLEVAWESLEDAGIPPDSVAGSAVGVFIGGFIIDHATTVTTPFNRTLVNTHSAVSFTHTVLSARVAYHLDLRGPCMTIDTACSSSLVALHQACEAIRHGDAALALVGGVNVMYRPETNLAMCKSQLLAKDGRSKSFDASGDGYGRGEGAGIVVLKPLTEARRDGDLVYAVIRGTGVNQDGRTDGITVPNDEAQADLIRSVCEKAGVQSTQICYIEAHGTGTAVGDPKECSALGRALGRGGDPSDACWVGSVKSNIGHLEAAAGIAGVIKTALVLHHRSIPPVANLKTPNPMIDFPSLGLRLPSQVEVLPDCDESKLLAGVNSFGYGGTNAHAILQAVKQKISPAIEAPHQYYFLPLSARSEKALQELARRYCTMLNKGPEADLHDICWSAATRRTHHHFRFAVVGGSRSVLLEQLRQFSDGTSAHLPYAKCPPGHGSRRPVFVFTGMGPQWWAMGRKLLASEPVFRAMAERCDKVFQRIAGWSILREMARDEANSCIMETQIAQPANFLIQASLDALWRSKGVTPSAIVGHSVGEVTAAYAAGMLTLEDAITVSYHRSRLQKTLAGQGAMLAVGLDEAAAQALVDEYGEGKVSFAAVNSPSSLTLTGDASVLKKISADLENKGIFNRFLRVELAYHSPIMDLLCDETLSVLSDLNPHQPKIPFYSTVTGEKVESALCDADYWYANIRQPVYFAKAIGALSRDGYNLFLEIGPHPVLGNSIKESAAHVNLNKARIISSLNRNESEVDAFYRALGDLYVNGATIDWGKFYPQGGRIVCLPLYPWQREYYWLRESEEAIFDRKGSRIDHPLLGHRRDSPEAVWEQSLNAQFLPWLSEHKIQGLMVMPGAAFIEIGLALFDMVTDRQTAGALEDISFQRALVINDLDEPLLHTRYDQERQRFSIYSRSRDNQFWTLHAQGGVSRVKPSMPEAVDLLELRRRCTERENIDVLYQRLAQRGMDYGPSFQGIREIWRGRDELLVRVALICDESTLYPGTIDSSDAGGYYRLHPTQLDAVFQSFVSLLDGDDAKSFVPVSVDQIRFCQYPDSELWAYGRIILRHPERIEVDVCLCNEQGKVMVDIRQLCYQALSSVVGQGEGMRRQPEDWLYQVIWEELSIPDQTETNKGRWLVFIDQKGRAESIAIALERVGEEVTRVASSESETLCQRENGDFYLPPHQPEDIAALLAQVDLSHYRGVVYGWGLDCDAGSDPDGRLAAYDWIACVRGVGGASSAEHPLTLFLLTENAQPVGMPPFNVSAATLVGLGRVAVAEYPMDCTLIDLPINVTKEIQEMLLAELLGNDLELEIALRPGKRYGYRLDRCPREKLLGIAGLQSFGLSGRDAFMLELASDEYCWREAQLEGIEQEQLKIHVEYAAIPVGGLKSGGDTLIGVGGRIVAGDAPGGIVDEPIIGLFPVSRLSSYITLPTSRLCVIPQVDQAVSSSLVKRVVNGTRRLIGNSGSSNAPVAVRRAASLLPFVKAMFAVRAVAALKSGERILIHSASDDMDLAAAQVALALGAEVFATYSNKAKRDALSGLGVSYIYPIDTLGFIDKVIQDSDGYGVDVVFNTLDGELAKKSLALLASFGRFVDFTRNVHDFGSMAGRYQNLSIHRIVIEELFEQQIELFRSYMVDVGKGFDSGSYIPLDPPLFTADLVTDAFTAAADQTVALEIGAADLVDVLPAESFTNIIRSDGSYMVTGGFGGFGLVVARWLAVRGARSLVLVGRRGASEDDARQVVRELENQGVSVFAVAADVGKEDEVRHLISEIQTKHPPLVGVFHTAGVLDDGMLEELTQEQLDIVLQPKAMGAWYLHQHTRELPLHCFVLFSSVSALVGKPGQGNYVAANAFLDQLAHSRRSEGLPGLSLNWGVLAQVGMAARQKVEDRLARIGIGSFTPDEAMQMMDWALLGDQPQLGLMNVDWHTWWETNRAPSAARRYGALLEGVDFDQKNPAEAFLFELNELDPDERSAFMIAWMVNLCSVVMRLPEDSVDPDAPLSALGLDSLMGVELQGAVEINSGVSLSVLDILQGGSIKDLSDKILNRLGV